MRGWLLKIETSNELKGTITVPFHDRSAAYDSLKGIQERMQRGGGLYGLPGITTLDISEVIGLSVVECDDGETNEEPTLPTAT